MLLLLAALAIAPVNHTIEVTYHLSTHHAHDYVGEGEEFNSKHRFIGLEYREGDVGFAAATFVNSYFKRSYQLDYAKYWQVIDNVEASVRVGVVSGYSEFQPCRGQNICPTVTAGLSYTAFDYVVPKVSVGFGFAALSFSARF